jgi:hypothetical protein
VRFKLCGSYFDERPLVGFKSSGEWQVASDEKSPRTAKSRRVSVNQNSAPRSLSGAGIYGEGFLFGRGGRRILEHHQCGKLSPMILTMLGPISSASPNGQAPLWSLFLILVAGYVGVSAWRYYLKRRRDTQISLAHLVFITVGCLNMILIGAWGLFRPR